MAWWRLSDTIPQSARTIVNARNVYPQSTNSYWVKFCVCKFKCKCKLKLSSYKLEAWWCLSDTIPWTLGINANAKNTSRNASPSPVRSFVLTVVNARNVPFFWIVGLLDAWTLEQWWCPFAGRAKSKYFMKHLPYFSIWWSAIFLALVPHCISDSTCVFLALDVVPLVHLSIVNSTRHFFCTSVPHDSISSFLVTRLDI